MSALSRWQVALWPLVRRRRSFLPSYCRLAILLFFVPLFSLPRLPATPVSYAASLAASVAAPVAVSWPTIGLESFASGFHSSIDLESANDGTGRLFVVEQQGVVYVIENGQRMGDPFLDITDEVGSSCNECGLLGIAFPRDYANKGFFLVNYTSAHNQVAGDTGDRNGDHDTVIARFQISSNLNVADEDSEEKVLVINQPADNHNGGHLLYGPDDYLYIGMGDGGGGGDTYRNGQDHRSLLGKILRIQVGGAGGYRIPPTNPFINNSGYRPEIWAEGVRNPWRFGFDDVTGDFYLADVGQDTFEEVNHIAAADLGNGGFNFGWVTMEGNSCYPPDGDQDCERTGLTLPVATYTHSEGCSITGGSVLDFHTPGQAPIYIYGDFCSGIIWGLQKDGDQWVSSQLLDSDELITSFGRDEDGTLYLASRDNGIFKIVNKSAGSLHYSFLPGVKK